MRNVCKLAVFALLLTGISLAQQEVSPDHFEAEPAKQPVKVKHVVKSSQANVRVAQTKHRASKSTNKTMAIARVSGNLRSAAADEEQCPIFGSFANSETPKGRN